MVSAENKHIDKKTALTRAARWCAYQERAHSEVRSKLYEWGVYPGEVDWVISSLISENYLNEERFANAYASGKFRIKKWGRQKIKQGLKIRQVPDKLIQKALNTIDDEEYLQTMLDIALKKQWLIKESNKLKHKFKLVSFLQTRGFESDLIFEMLNANNLY